MTPSTQEVLASLLSTFDKPVTFLSLVADYIKFCLDDKEAPQIQNKDNLHEFLADTIEAYFDAINIPFLTKLTNTVTESVGALAPIEYEAFKLNTSDPSAVEAEELLYRVYKEITASQRYKEECTHYISVIKHAITNLTTLSNSVNNLVCDDDIAKGAFLLPRDRERFALKFTTDIQSYIDTLKTSIASLTLSVENVLSPRMELLKRVDSAIRLLSKFIEFESQINPQQSKRRTTPAKHGADLTKGSGFEVHEL